MANNKVTLHRVISASPDKVFRAFGNEDAISSWLPPFGFTCKVHNMDFKTGGTYKMSFTNFTTGGQHSFGEKYLEIRQDSFIQYTDQFDDPGLPGEMITTVKLTRVPCGTDLHIVQEGIPEVIPVEMCYLGWQDSLEKLKKLVEPDIPDA